MSLFSLFCRKISLSLYVALYSKLFPKLWVKTKRKRQQRLHDILNEETGWMWVGIDCNDKEPHVCAATVYLKAGQQDDDTEGCDSATPTMAKSKSPPLNQ